MRSKLQVLKMELQDLNDKLERYIKEIKWIHKRIDSVKDEMEPNKVENERLKNENLIIMK